MPNSGIVVVVAGQDNTEAVFKQIESHLKGVKTQAHETEGALEKIGERATHLLEYFAVKDLAREALNQVKELVVGSLEFGEAMEKASAKTGLSVGTLSTLHYAAGVTSSDFDAMSQAVARLDQNIGKAADGDKTAQSFMKALGLNAKELAGQADGAEIAFKKFAQTIAATENPIERVRLATGLLGRAGAEQLDLLIKIGNNWDFYKQKATEAGVQLDGKTAAALAATNEKLRDMQQKIHGAELAFTEGFTPGLEQMVEVISGGKNSREEMELWGQRMAKTLAFVAEAAYASAAGLEIVFGVGEALIPGMGDVARKDLAAVKDLMTKAQQMHDIAFGGPAAPKSTPEPSDTPHGKPFTGAPVPDGSANKLDAAKKRRDEAQGRLDEQAEQLKAARAKAAETEQLAQLEGDHKKNLISDQEFYNKKLAIQAAAIEEEKAAELKKQGVIDAQIAVLGSDAKKVGGAKRVEDEAKILQLRTQRLAIDGQIAALDGQAAKAKIDAATALDELDRKRLQRSDELAAKREGILGNSVDARLKQGADTYADQREALVANYGTGSDEVRNADANESDAQDQIRAKGAEEQFGAVDASLKSQRAVVEDAAARGSMSTLEARQRKIELDHEEAQALQPLLEAYQRLAANDDLAATAKVAELQTKIRELNNPVDEVSAHIREGFDGAFESLFEGLDQGDKAFQNFGRSVEKTMEQALYKQTIEPLIQRSVGAAFPNKQPGAPRGDAIFEGIAAKIFHPGGSPSVPAAEPTTDVGGGIAQKALGGIGGVLGKLGLPGASAVSAAAGAKGGGVITIQLVNESGTPFKIGDLSAQGDLQKDKILTVIQDSFNEGGLMRNLLGFGS